ncbi:MAG: spore coat protein [Clostridia bacterium]|nr:spore coat protein [Clostridia bacterium]
MMTWTQKEASLLKDLKGQEQLCVDKYGKYANEACDPELKDIFRQIQQTEQSHLQTVTSLLNGQMPQQNGQQNQNSQQKQQNQQNLQRYAEFPPQGAADVQQAMQHDKFLAEDALCTEKEVSGAYNVSIFEFRDPQVRQLLHQIQGAEQQHGEMLYQYMARNGMYQAQ